MTEYIKHTVDHVIEEQSEDGSFPEGHNGPYYDKETPVRNTAHWLITLCFLYEKFNDKKYEVSANKAADYLLSKNARPMDATFWCRRNPEKDFSNGLIGQAWAMEALMYASEVLHRKDCYELAERVYFIHPWDEKAKLWRRVNVDGSYRSFDGTFNHQLWFAAISSQLNRTDVAKKRTREFFDQVAKRVEVYKNGVICHNSRIDFSEISKSSFLRNSIRFYLDNFRRIRKRKNLYVKSVGYHSFNMYAFSILKETFPEDVFWHSKKFNMMFSVINDLKFQNVLDVCPYSYPYNPPGIEFAYSVDVFKGDTKEVQWWLRQQYNKTYDTNTGDFMTKDVPDPDTSSARIYEVVRLMKRNNNIK